MQRPMCQVAIVYGAGVILADRMACALFLLLLAAGALALAACFVAHRSRWLLALALLLSGAAGMTVQKAVLSPYDLRRIVGEEPRLARLRGRLVETPYHRERVRQERESWRSLAEIEASFICWPGDQWRPACGRVLVNTPGLLSTDFFGGRLAEVEGVILRPQPPAAPGLFDYGAFLARQGIHYQFNALATNNWLALDGERHPRPPLADRFSTWAMAVLARGLPAEDKPLQLLWAMTLGWKTAFNGEVAEPFMRSGTMHVFAISGLHIALIASLLVAGLRVLRAPRWLCGLLVMPLIWAYTGVTGWQASAIRSTIMASVILAGWSLRRPSDLINSLAGAAFIILAWDPQQLFQASFQLSFAVVLSLALITPVLDEGRRRWLAPEPMLPSRLRPRWHGWVQRPLEYVLGSLGVSLAAWIGSLPLIAWYFHLFTPASLPANLVVVPLSSAALACNMGSLCTGGWLPGATVLLNHAAWFFMVLMIRASNWAAQLPGGSIGVRSPSPAATALYYGLLGFILFPAWRRPGIRRWSVALLMVLAAVCLGQWCQARSTARLTVLPLNGAEAVYVAATSGQGDLLVNCGNDSAFEFTLKPFLRAEGVNHLDTFLLTHGAVRSSGAAQHVRELFDPRRILFSQVTFRSSAYREQTRAMARIPRLTRTIQDGDRIGPWTVLHPAPGDRFAHAVDNAVVLLGEIGGCRILLLSELGKPGQHALLARHPDLRADVVVSGIPGHTEPLAEGLLDAIQPRLIIVTDSEYPATQRASIKLRERLGERQVPVLYTRECRAVCLETRHGTCAVTSMNGVQIQWSHKPAAR